MNYRTTALVLASAMFATMVSPVLAKTIKSSGTVCYTGKLDMIATSKKDAGWTFKLSFTYVSDDKDPARGSSGRCLGSGGSINGKPESAPWFCISNNADGSMHMARGEGGIKGNKGVYFGGTENRKGISGSFVGAAGIQLPAEQGSFAACRHSTGEIIIPD